jgi:hypothetical protein
MVTTGDSTLWFNKEELINVLVGKCVSNGVPKKLTVFWDSGANAHVTDSMSVFIEGTVRDCYVPVAGVHGSKKVARKCGDVVISLTDDKRVIVTALYVEGVELGESGDNCPCVLIGVRKFVKEALFGVLFHEDGDHVKFVKENEVIGSVRCDYHNLLYVSDQSGEKDRVCCALTDVAVDVFLSGVSDDKLKRVLLTMNDDESKIVEDEENDSGGGEDEVVLNKSESDEVEGVSDAYAFRK